MDYGLKSILSYAILGFQNLRSFLMYLAKSKASSLINVSTVCLFPTLLSEFQLVGNIIVGKVVVQMLRKLAQGLALSACEKNKQSSSPKRM